MLFQRTHLISFGQENKKDEAVTATESMWATLLKLCILVSISLGYVFPWNNWGGNSCSGQVCIQRYELTRIRLV